MTVRLYKLLIILEGLIILAGFLFIVYLSTYNLNLIREKNVIANDLSLEQAKTPQRTVIVEKKKNYKTLFDQCSQEKFELGDENMLLRKELGLTQTEQLKTNEQSMR